MGVETLDIFSLTLFDKHSPIALFLLSSKDLFIPNVRNCNQINCLIGENILKRNFLELIIEQSKDARFQHIKH